MTTLALTANGLLAPGVHVATLEEIEAAFGASNPRRRDLFAKLTRFVDKIRPAGVFDLLIDGSFTTDKEAPGDIDAVLEFPSVAALRATYTFVLDSFAVKREYELHLFVGPPGGMMPGFFQTLKPEEALLRSVPQTHKRGIVKVTL